MMSVLWFYRPEHAEGGPIYGSLENEVFAAKHKDETLVACIEDRGYVLTFNEYCRQVADNLTFSLHWAVNLLSMVAIENFIIKTFSLCWSLFIK